MRNNIIRTLDLLRPYLPDGTPITTSIEEQHLKEAAEARVEEEVQRRQELEVEIERLRTQLGVVNFLSL